MENARHDRRPRRRPGCGPSRARRAAAAVVVDLSDLVDADPSPRRRLPPGPPARGLAAARPPPGAAIVLLSLTFSLLVAGIIARGEAAGADARAYWAGVRIWLNGGDPYHPTGPFMPYVYAPWMLPLFVPWALLPWDVAWFVWRVGTILLLLWTIHWAYRRRPLTTAVTIAVLGFPLGANLDTGNINLQLTLMLWAAQFTGPRLGGLLWALATWMKWVPVILLPVCPAARRWGLVWLAVSVGLSLLTAADHHPAPGAVRVRGAAGPTRLPGLPLGRRPVVYRRADPFDFVRPATWRRWLGRGRAGPRPHGGCRSSAAPAPRGRPRGSRSSRRRSSTGRSSSAPTPNRTTAIHRAARGPEPSGHRRRP